MLNIAVMVSGGGTNLQALLDAQEADNLGPGRIVCVIASKENVGALGRAEASSVPGEVCRRTAFSSEEEYENALFAILDKYNVDLIVLAGFLSILSKRVTEKYANRIINIHPALIPSFCGKGFYGLKVHEAALAAGVKVTGATVHFVNEIPDGGAIIAQKAVYIEQDDTPETLQRRVMEQAEWILLPQVVRQFCEGKIKIVDNKTYITEEKQDV